MAGVVKKGFLEVKTKKGKLGSSYKRKFVILRRNTNEGTKGVEIMDHEGDTEDVEYLPLSGVWTVQDKASQNKRRYAFELVIGPHIVMTFSCPSLTEREEWTESFHILNRVSSYSPPLNAPDMYPVTLERNISTVEINVFGPCLLRIQDGAIVLYSECGRNKLHHWAAENIKNLTLAKDQLKLEAYRPGSDTLMDFFLNTEIDVGRLILTSWNMALMRSVDPQKLNLISSYICNQKDDKTTGGGGGSKSNSLSKNFFGSLKQKERERVNGVKEEKGVRRVRSFSEKIHHDIRLSPDPHNTSRLSIASQESYTINSVPQQIASDEENLNTPPPIPPRAPRRPHSLGMDAIDSAIIRPDPDYSTIPDHQEPSKSLEIRKIETPPSSQNRPSTSSNASIDKELDDLLRDIEEDNHRKVQRRLTLDSSSNYKTPTSVFESKSRTIGGGGIRYSENFVRQKKEFYDTHGPSHEASDYLEPIPSQRAILEQAKRASNPPLLNNLIHKDTEEDLLLQQIKRHSTSGDFSSMRLKDPTSHHDYSIIPDRVMPPAPQHSHTASTDSTQSAPELPPRFRRSQGPLDYEPPSPPSIAPPTSPGKSLRILGNSTSQIEDISPYATTKGLHIETTHPTGPSPPPLPPRSPVRHLRERVSVPNTNTRCNHCNGMKQKQTLSKTQSLADHHSKHHTHYNHAHNNHTSSSSVDGGSLPDLWGKVTPGDHYSSQSSESSTHSSNKGHSSRNPSLSSEETTPSTDKDKSLESVLQSLDECMKGLEILGTDEPTPPNTSTVVVPRRNHSCKENHATRIDQALTNTQQIQNDLLLAKKEHRKSLDQLHRSTSVLTHKKSPPSYGRHTSMTIHRSSPSMPEFDMTPPTVPPRSLVSLHSTPSPPTQLEGGTVGHTPIHRYLSQNAPDKSNTVFIYHMNNRIGNTPSSVV